MVADFKKIYFVLLISTLSAIILFGLSALFWLKNQPSLSDSQQSDFSKQAVDKRASDGVKDSAKTVKEETKLFWHLKFVPFDISDAELNSIVKAGFKILSVEWGMDDVETAEVMNLLNRLQERQLQIILDAGFSAGAWGYQKGSDGPEQKPVWQKEKVENWVRQFKNHKAVYGWDISNEAGENLTNNDGLRISLAQLKTAATDVRAVDSIHPIIIRMHYWDEYDGDFGQKNPFDKNIADIVILNLYSNYSEDGKTKLLPEMINDSAQILINKIKSIDPNVRVWLSLAAYSEPPMFLKPSSQDVQSDLTASLKLKGIESIGFFGWGETDGDWYLPQDGPDLLEAIKKIIR